MRWLRSYPEPKPEHRTYVEDAFTERFFNANYDYSGLAEYDDDILLIEWDIAASPEMLEKFGVAARREPDKVLVAPHRLYDHRPEPVWAHRRIERDGTERWIRENELFCDLFAFGLVYLPQQHIRAFLESPKETRGTPVGVKPEDYTDYRFIDQTFSMWYHRQGLGPVHVAWYVRPVHLHFP